MQIVETGRGRKRGHLWIELSAYPDGIDTEIHRTGETYNCGHCLDPHPVETPRPPALASVQLIADTPNGEEEAVAAALRTLGEHALVEEIQAGVQA